MSRTSDRFHPARQAFEAVPGAPGPLASRRTQGSDWILGEDIWSGLRRLDHRMARPVRQAWARLAAWTRRPAKPGARDRARCRLQQWPIALRWPWSMRIRSIDTASPTPWRVRGLWWWRREERPR